MRLMLSFLILAAIGCSSNPTGYVPSKNKQGYSDRIVENELRVATFQGNYSTKKDKAELYAKFRALEICRDMGKTYTHIFVVKDKSYAKEVTQTTSSSPNYYYGMSPYYGGVGMYGTGVGVAYGATSTHTSTDTHTYPMFEVYFECTEKPLDARISLSNLSEAQMETLVKDVQGGVQVEEVLPDSPNIGKLQKADIIYKANGERVTTVLDVYRAARKVNQQNLKVDFFRDGKPKETTVSFIDVTEMVDHAQKEILKEACKIDVIKDKQAICKK